MAQRSRYSQEVRERAVRRVALFCIAGVSIALAIPVEAEPTFILKKYEGFTVVIDCRHNGPIAYWMTLSADTGDEPRLNDFQLDESIPAHCQMTTGDSFQVTDQEENQFGKFHRGHLADANSLDGSEQSMADSFFVTNMLPQAARFNGGGGAWRRTEQISECYREITTLHIWGGVLWGADATNDLFRDSHNVTTPDHWWKVIYREDTNTYISWAFMNNQDERRAVMDDRIVTLEELKPHLEFVPDFGPAEDATASTETWLVEGSDPLRCEGTEASSG